VWPRVRGAVVIDTDLFQQQAMAIPSERPVRMAHVLRDKGAEVHVVEWLRWQSGLPAQETRDGLHYDRVTLPVPAGGLLRRAAFLRRMSRVMADHIVQANPEGIAAGNEELLRACVGARRRLGGVPLFYDSPENWVGMVAEDHPLEARLYALAQRQLAPHIEHVFAPVEAVKEHWERLGVPATMIYNSRDGVALRKHALPRAEAKRKLGLPEDAFVIGFLGSMHPQQGLAPCVQALAELPSDVRMVAIGGSDAERARLVELAKAQRVADRLRILAPIPGDTWVEVPCAFDAALLTVHGEGINFEHRLPLKTFDYMALGIPTVVSDYTELRQVVVERVGFGLPVTPGDSASIREAVLQLRADEGLRRAMAKRAVEAFDSTYSGEKQKERLRATHPFWR